MSGGGGGASAKALSFFDVREKSACGLLIFLIQLAIFLGAAVFALWAGLHYEGVSCDKPIDTWLFVTGITALSLMGAVFLVILLLACGTATENGCAVGMALCFTCLICLGAVFQFAWFIVGNVWVFSTNVTECPGGSDELYLIGYWFIIGQYIAMGVSLVFSCLSMCCKIGSSMSQN